jgi:hypothetical protein
LGGGESAGARAAMNVRLTELSRLKIVFIMHRHGTVTCNANANACAPRADFHRKCSRRNPGAKKRV